MPSAVPRYYEARSRLTELANGIPDGAPFPSERELADLLGMSRTTIRKALDDLVLQGKLIRGAGRQGTVVASRAQTRRLSVTALVNDLVPRRTVSFKHVGDTHDLVHVEWVLHADDDQPIGLKSSYLPAARFRDFVERYDPATPLRRFLRDHYSIRFAETHPWCTTVLATPRVARLLDTRPTTPMMSLAWVSRDTAGVPVERSWTALRGDRTHLTMHIPGGAE
ncbi:GntR family transcriptional regulator [Lentzea sp. NBRC 105346]|uniref:GntR family transcriptional regulator n=1 Tax=Lentzea sp. NBRC 105346 TaxID=3032205 RepID=UPI00249FF51F|nr:GntR family transcriptional regulator [Lentzea sp. NBRC 105346]GLZ28644.1 GntR family transcriptional regulator [Lentzea sp. NBRC 105346]